MGGGTRLFLIAAVSLVMMAPGRLLASGDEMLGQEGSFPSAEVSILHGELVALRARVRRLEGKSECPAVEAIERRALAQAHSALLRANSRQLVTLEMGQASVFHVNGVGARPVANCVVGYRLASGIGSDGPWVRKAIVVDVPLEDGEWEALSACE